MNTAKLSGTRRMHQLKEFSAARARDLGRKVEKGLIDSAKVIDSGWTAAKNVFGQKQIVTPDGTVFRETVENTHAVENIFRAKIEDVNGIGKSKGTGNVHRSDIDEVIKNDYDINGNLINRSIVPKGYESVEDFLKVVDDTTIKEYGYDSIEEFKAVVGHVEDYLNASPKNNIVNKGLAGGKHVKGVDYDVLGFPIFKGDDVKFTHRLE